MDDPLATAILTTYPYPIAHAYRRLLSAGTWEERTRRAAELFEFGQRAVTLCLLCEYLNQDLHLLNDAQLDAKLVRYLPEASAGTWNDIFFGLLRAYRDHRERMFLPELHDAFWSTDGKGVPTVRPDVRKAFDRLVVVRNRLAHHREMPRGDEEWAVLGADVIDGVRTVLGRFGFLAQMDIVRYLGRDGDETVYERFTGLTISQERGPLRPASERDGLRPGWLYVRRRNGTALNIHPLWVLWSDGPADSIVPVADARHDAAIFERLNDGSVEYLATVPGHVLADAQELFAAVRSLIDHNLQAVKLAPKRAVLSWDAIRQAAARVTNKQSDGMLTKYERDLYLQRTDTVTAFHEFLDASPARCFVLTGKSGVGKTNFVLSLVDVLADRKDVAVAVFNGAHAPHDRPIVDDVRDELLRGVDVESLREPDLLAILDRQRGMDRKRLVLVFDAINENPNAVEVLKRVNELVEVDGYPWLKVIVTSRPEAWRAMKSGLLHEYGIQLPESRYFRRSGSREVAVELEGFTFVEAVQMSGFVPNELPDVYEKYRLKHGVTTPYDDLSAATRAMLRDPLMLKLVTETYAGEAVPEHLRETEIYGDYIRGLMKWNRLRPADLDLLRDELLPIMLFPGHYENRILRAEVYRQRPAERGPLWERIRSEDVLYGEPVNQGFRNLCDTEILEVSGPPDAWEIRFKYERFYDSFAGERLLALARESGDAVAFLTDRARETLDKPFLWGAVSSALVDLGKADGAAALQPLCFLDEQRVKELMTEVLVTLGREHPEPVRALLHRIVPPSEQLGRFRRILSVIRPPASSGSPAGLRARKLAVEVAGELGFVDCLEVAALHRHPSVRAAAIRAIFHLWQRDPAAGFAALDAIGGRAVAGLVPDFTAVETALVLSLSLLFDAPRDPDVQSRLRALWKPVIARVFLAKSGSGGIARITRAFMANRVVGLIIGIVFKLLRDMPQYSRVHYEDFVVFFKRPQSEKDLYRRLVSYTDPNGTYTRAEVERDLLATLPIRDLVIGGVLNMVLVVQAERDQEAFVPFLMGPFFDGSQADPVPTPYVGDTSFPLQNLLLRDPHRDWSLFTNYLKVLDVCQFYYRDHPSIPGLSLDYFYSGIGAGGLSPVIWILAHHGGTSHPLWGWVVERVERYARERDLAFFQRLMESELTSTGIQMREPGIALEVLELCLRLDWPEVTDLAYTFLSRMRLTYPNEVDDFLERMQFSDDTRLMIRTNEPVESVGGLLGMRTWYFVRDEMLMGTDTIRLDLTDILDHAAFSRTHRHWVDYIIRRIVNLLYGEPLLSLPAGSGPAR